MSQLHFTGEEGVYNPPKLSHRGLTAPAEARVCVEEQLTRPFSPCSSSSGCVVSQKPQKAALKKKKKNQWTRLWRPLVAADMRFSRTRKVPLAVQADSVVAVR